MEYRCERCGKTFDRQFNYQRHVSKRQRKCTIRNPFAIDTQTLLALLKNVRYPINDTDIDSIWTTICHVQFVEKQHTFDLIWHLFQNCSLAQIKAILEKSHLPRMKTHLLAVYGYIIKLKSDGIHQVCSKPIQNIINLFDQFR